MKIKKSIQIITLLALAMFVFQSCSDDKKAEKAATETNVNANKAAEKAMKCEPGKCGDAMKAEKDTKVVKDTVKATTETMKCGAGKCGDAMKVKEDKVTK